MKAGSRNIYYLSAPSRHLAETSPYMEAMQQRDIEVLYCFENYDELVLMNLGQFDKKNLKSVENELVEDKTDVSSTIDEKNTESLSQEQADDLLSWLQVVLGHRVSKTKITKRLVSHPCVITVNEMGAARHFLKTALADKTDEEKFRVLQPTLEVNVAHPIMKKLYSLKSTNSELARLVAEQVYDNSMIAAGLVEDPRKMLGRLNSILEQALEKH
jgi:TNF receptor-associated protein 1